MKQELCCLVNRAFYCEGCGRSWCEEHCKGLDGPGNGDHAYVDKFKWGCPKVGSVYVGRYYRGYTAKHVAGFFTTDPTKSEDAIT